MQKRILSAILAAACCVGMSATAFAASGYGSDPDSDDYKPSTSWDDYGTNSSNTPATVETVSTTQAVNSAKEAIKNTSEGSTASVKVQNARSITADAVKAVAEQAKSAGVSAVIHADKVQNGAVVARFYIDAAKAASLPEKIDLGVSTDSAIAKNTEKVFEKFFTNTVSVIDLAHQGSYGTSLELAVQVNLDKLDTSKLTFFAYDAKTNTFSQITAPKYYIDSNGYLHFTTSVGGAIVISDKALTAK